MTVPGSDRVEYRHGSTYIDGYEVTKVGEYLGWAIYRTTENNPIATLFIAVSLTATEGLTSSQARNLEGIKRIIRRKEGFE